MGRPPLFARAMTSAERVRRHRSNKPLAPSRAALKKENAALRERIAALEAQIEALKAARSVGGF